MKHILPELPYALDALQPVLSKETLEFHYGKHHKGYVDKLNQLIPNTEFENMPLLDIVKNANGPIFNNAGQIWNHTFYWNSLSPKARAPKDELLESLQKSFGSVDQFMDQFQLAATNLFGSGWAWLCLDAKLQKLSIEVTSNAENPIRAGKYPLLTCDVWEHAYYIDYRNERARYLKEVRSLLNWEFAEQNFLSALRLAAA